MKVAKCIKCTKEINRLDSECDSKPDQAMWDGGIVGSIAASYGSELDGNMYWIAICDECVKTCSDLQVLTFIGNYLENA